MSSGGASPDRSTASRPPRKEPAITPSLCDASCSAPTGVQQTRPLTEVHAYANVRGGRGSRSASLRQPSPYYYGDLAHYRKAASLGPQHRYTVTADGLFVDLDRENSSSEDGLSMPPRRSCTTCRPHLHHHHHQPAVFYLPSPRHSADLDEMAARARQIYETAFDCKVARSDDDLDDVDRVSNHPILLQLSGDGRVIGVESFPSSSSSNIDPTSSSLQGPTKNRRKAAVRADGSRRQKNASIRVQPNNENSVVSILSEELENLELNNSESRESNVSQLPLRGYTPSPPSTAPLPTKFQQSKDNLAMNSIKSAPNLPSQPAHPRLKDLRLPVKSLRARETPASSEGSIIEIKSRSNNNAEFGCSNRVRNMIQESQTEGKGRPRLHNGLFLEIKGRPTSDTDTPEMHRFRGSKESGPILEFKGRPGNRRRHNYSSMESMATSSSGGSMESIRSSTSEGNRSTSSSESRHSTSLSSHSSDSGNNSCFQNLHHASPLSGFISHHANKLHILSPISDKSSQEPASETSDNIKNNNSQKVSPEDAENGITNQSTTVAVPDNNVNIKIKRRMPQNKNLLNLAFQQATAGDTEIQGSDSGISIHSRDGIKSRNAFLGFLKLNQAPADNSNSSIAVDANNGQLDFSDLPFDMPKLRRRRAAAQDACTSGSATSVDLRELPFDMPKLRRRLRAPAPTSPGSSGGSHASSSHSVQEADRGQQG